MKNLHKIAFRSSADSSFQAAFISPAIGEESRPLLVALHTWSCSLDVGVEKYYEACQQKNWHLIYPNFRAANVRPEACASELVRQDIVDAVKFMEEHYLIDSDRIYLTGGSGGGHASLYLAGRHPEIWAGVSAWCPISDLIAWHKECSKDSRFQGYAEHIELVCQGNPQLDEAAKKEAKLRSPLTYLKNATAIPVDINTGIHDGHTGSVPISHAIEAYNILAKENEKISIEDMDYMLKNRKVPEHLSYNDKDENFAENYVLLRKQSVNTRLTLFEGGHDMLISPCIEWLEKQKKGQEANWQKGERTLSLQQTSKKLTG